MKHLKFINLASTLAQRVRQLRDARNLTVRDLARLTKFGTNRIEDIESGIETWLSTTDRQILAKVLVVEPSVIQEVENKTNTEIEDEFLQKVSKNISESILNGARDLECPICGGTLKCSVQRGIDLDDNPIYFAKAFCTKCPFVLR
jgi:DNA phosphorothioation-dependent restriction protein DptG